MSRSFEWYIEAFTIFSKYCKQPHLCAEHDRIWSDPQPSEVTKEDLKRLEELGWEPDEDISRFVHYV